MTEIGDIAAGRLDATRLAENFADAHPPLSPAQAVVEANRCYFCHDAPCVEACPTGIDVPSFIRKIASGNLRGSAQTILELNILGGSCARVCPTEELCERACVHTAQEHKPIQIGALQRHATDWLMTQGIAPFAREATTGRKIAVVGAGPAGLACAHGLARHGHDVTIFEARPKPGGLNEYGIAAYKVADDYAQREIDFILAIGGITIEYDKTLGLDFTLDTLRRDFDAVFLGIGQAGVNALGLDGEELKGLRDAIDFIAELRQTPKHRVAVGRRVVVIGGGNTAIDAATQARLLGAEDVTIVYRRGPEHMTATEKEQAWALTNNVRIRYWAAPTRLISTASSSWSGLTGPSVTTQYGSADPPVEPVTSSSWSGSTGPSVTAQYGSADPPVEPVTSSSWSGSTGPSVTAQYGSADPPVEPVTSSSWSGSTGPSVTAQYGSADPPVEPVTSSSWSGSTGPSVTAQYGSADPPVEPGDDGRIGVGDDGEDLSRPPVTGLEFARTTLDASGRLTLTDETFVLEADMVLKAIGQTFVTAPVQRADEVPEVRNGRIVIDAERRTTLPGVYAGGDCVPGADLTVTAVQDGKLAAAAIHRQLTG